jgi:hypothetical protein
MSFNEKINELSQRASNSEFLKYLNTEAATKNALVQPFISALGYDVSDPQEVIPEFSADVGIKKGEKVDYAIMHNEEIIMLIECKQAKTDLSEADMSQLLRYFMVTKARIGILTNGIRYLFFTDLEKPNIMDKRPFLEFDLAKPRKNVLLEVGKLTKESFHLESVISTASELKYITEIKRILQTQFDNPDDNFVRYFFTQLKPKPGTPFAGSIKDQFTEWVKEACKQFLAERITDRIQVITDEPPKDEIRETETTAVVSGDQAWNINELNLYLNNSTRYQRILLAAILQVDKANPTKTNILYLMNEIARKRPSENVTKEIGGLDIAGARSGLTMRRKPFKKEDIIDGYWDKDKRDHVYRIKQQYEQVATDWAKKEGLWMN